MLYAIIGVLVLLVDQFTKYLTVANVALNTYDGPSLLGLVGITYIRNYGAAFGLLENKRWLLFIVLVVFLAVMVFLLLKGFIRTPFSRWTGVLLTAGALGNGIDRLIYGYVVDMIEVLPGKASLPIFNLADCLITIGGILFCVSLILGRKHREEDMEDELAWADEPPRRKPRRADPFSEPEEGAHDPFAAGRVPRRAHRGQEESPPARSRRRAPEEEKATLEDLVPARRPRRPETAEETPVRTRRPAAQSAAEEAPVRTRRPAAQPVAEDAPVRTRRPAAQSAAEEAPVRTRRPAAQSAAEEAPVHTRRPAAQSAAEDAPVRTRRPTPQSVTEEAPVRPQRKAAPAAPKAPKAPAADEFDLDSILAEFK